jgi:hypothetical protein
MNLALISEYAGSDSAHWETEQNENKSKYGSLSMKLRTFREDLMKIIRRILRPAFYVNFQPKPPKFRFYKILLDCRMRWSKNHLSPLDL